MRSYRQYCAMAKALDVVGDRWTLLIVRELLLRGPSRYTDLRHGLPGIATNLLADRLRELEHAGIVRGEEAPPPVATNLFSLTERGEALKPVLRELGRWGAPLMVEPPQEEAFRTHWLAFPASLFLKDQAPDRAGVAIELRTGDEPMTVEAANGWVQTRVGVAQDPDLALTGTPHLILGVLTGQLELADAQAQGLGVDGDAEALRRVRRQPAAERPKAPATSG